MLPFDSYFPRFNPAPAEPPPRMVQALASPAYHYFHTQHPHTEMETIRPDFRDWPLLGGRSMEQFVKDNLKRKIRDQFSPREQKLFAHIPSARDELFFQTMRAVTTPLQVIYSPKPTHLGAAGYFQLEQRGPDFRPTIEITIHGADAHAANVTASVLHELRHYVQWLIGEVVGITGFGMPEAAIATPRSSYTVPSGLSRQRERDLHYVLTDNEYVTGLSDNIEVYRQFLLDGRWDPLTGMGFYAGIIPAPDHVLAVLRADDKSAALRGRIWANYAPGKWQRLYEELALLYGDATGKSAPPPPSLTKE